MKAITLILAVLAACVSGGLIADAVIRRWERG